MMFQIASADLQPKLIEAIASVEKEIAGRLYPNPDDVSTLHQLKSQLWSSYHANRVLLTDEEMSVFFPPPPRLIK